MNLSKRILFDQFEKVKCKDQWEAFQKCNQASEENIALSNQPIFEFVNFNKALKGFSDKYRCMIYNQAGGFLDLGSFQFPENASDIFITMIGPGVVKKYAWNSDDLKNSFFPLGCPYHGISIEFQLKQQDNSEQQDFQFSTFYHPQYEEVLETTKHFIVNQHLYFKNNQLFSI